MAEISSKMCRICLTDSSDDNISDSTCYAKFFIKVMSLESLKEKLLLCMWCRAALRRAMAVLTLALESEKTLHNKITTEVFINRKKHKLSYIHNCHIDIPPLGTECQDYKTENITVEIEEITNPLLDIQNNVEMERNDELQNANKKQINDEIDMKYMPVKSSDISIKESISNENSKYEFIGLEIGTKKNKKEFNYNELKFEVNYLNLDEQLKEIKLKKLKYKDFEFQCEMCYMGFRCNDVFEEHKIRHSELSGQHKCTVCALHFKSQDVLSQHLLAHKRRFKCLLCDSVFTRWSHCVAHRHKCGGAVEMVACLECAKIFSNEYSLKIHMKVHRSEKKYCCDQCDKKFGSKQRLTVHQRSHSGIKPFSCAECARSFATRSNLRAHSAVHATTSQHYCVECHTYYKTAKSLKRHFNESGKHVGSSKDMYSCKACIKKFSSEKSLNYHFTTRHGTEYRCNQCDKTFSSNSNLNKHVKCIHTVK